MAFSDITQAYCKAHRLYLTAGDAEMDDPAPILPFIIMDAAYHEFKKHISKLNLHHELKRMKNQWLDYYHSFNSLLLSCLNEDQKNFVIDKMDEYEEFVDDYMICIRPAIFESLTCLDFEDRYIVASLLQCNILTQIASIAYSEVHKDKDRKAQCPQLENMSRLCHKIYNRIIYLPENIDPNKNTNLIDAVTTLMNKTADWLKSYDKEYIQSKG